MFLRTWSHLCDALLLQKFDLIFDNFEPCSKSSWIPQFVIKFRFSVRCYWLKAVTPICTYVWLFPSLLSDLFSLIESKILEQSRPASSNRRTKERFVDMPSPIIDIIVTWAETKILKEKMKWTVQVLKVFTLSYICTNLTMSRVSPCTSFVLWPLPMCFTYNRTEPWSRLLDLLTSEVRYHWEQQKTQLHHKLWFLLFTSFYEGHINWLICLLTQSYVQW